jgi:hypothetical protein
MQVDVEVDDLPDIFDFTHPTSLPLSVEFGLGRVMVVARVQTVVPLCKISVPVGSVKATCQSLSFNMSRFQIRCIRSAWRKALLRTFALSNPGVHLQNEFAVFIIQVEIPLISDRTPDMT